MNLASQIGTDRTSVYSQDISQKSSNLLRLNLILNGLQHSIHNIVQGNTILNNRHVEKMDYIVSNPPFKLDFSEWRDQVESLPNSSERFFAGVPKIPNKKKESMAIYQLFIQYIIHSLKEDGQAAIVLPTGFITAQSGIDKKIRQHLVDEKMLAGVVSMPSNIFATTGTNVSILFIDKKNKGDVVLIDASNLGTKVKEGKTKRPCYLLRKSRKSSRPLSRKKPSRTFLSPSLMRTSRRRTTLSAQANTLTSSSTM